MVITVKLIASVTNILVMTNVTVAAHRNQRSVQQRCTIYFLIGEKYSIYIQEQQHWVCLLGYHVCVFGLFLFLSWINKELRLSCLYWDTAENGSWSTEGCWWVTVSGGRPLCACNHLTNFAFLVDAEAKFPPVSTINNTVVVTMISRERWFESFECMVLICTLFWLYVVWTWRTERTSF